jgi:hypothetical protein
MLHALGPGDAVRSSAVGFWSSLAFAVLLVAIDVAFVVMAVSMPGTEWAGLETYARTYRAIAFVPQTIGLVALPACVLMLASLHLHASEERRIWSLAGLAFGVAFAALLGSLCFIPVGILWPALQHGHWQGLDQFAFASPRSVAWGLNHFAWSLLGVALLLMACALHQRGLQGWIRRLFVINGLANASLPFAFALDLRALTLAVALLSWVFALPFAAALVAMMFRHT